MKRYILMSLLCVAVNAFGRRSGRVPPRLPSGTLAGGVQLQQQHIAPLPAGGTPPRAATPPPSPLAVQQQSLPAGGTPPRAAMPPRLPSGTLAGQQQLAELLGEEDDEGEMEKLNQ